MSVNELARVCAHSADAAEWEEFLRCTTPLASLAVTRVARLWVNRSSPALVDDIVQEVYLKLCEQERRILRQFEPRGEDSFLGLLRIVSTSVANDYFRRLYSIKRGGKVGISQTSGDSAPNPPSGQGDSTAIQRSVLFGQLDSLLRSAPQAVNDRDRHLFWLYYLQGFTAGEIASLPGVGLSPKGVESALRRICAWLRRQIESPPNKDRFDPVGRTTVRTRKENSPQIR
ncbi:MAG: sigma-70 family RNA polymerase sigma factor [Terracidiphilus sp.]